MKRILKVIISVVILTPVALEICIRLYVAGIPQSASAAVSAVPLPYQHASWYNAEFIAENTAIGQDFQPTDDGRPPRQDWHGKYINTQNKWRVTTDQPAAAPHTIWFLGSSTTFDVEVPDSYTKASYLQRLVGSNYRVENYGMTSANATQELGILKRLPVKSGDVVVMLDGSMDMFAARQILKNRQTLDPSPCRWLLDNVSWSMLVKTSCMLTWLNFVPDQALIQETLRDYSRAITRSHDWTIAHGAVFVHFLQPMIYNPTPTGYEIGLGSNADMYPVVYPLFRTVPYTIDLAHAEDGVRSQPIFFDQVHTNQIGNEAVARAIYAALFQEL